MLRPLCAAVEAAGLNAGAAAEAVLDPEVASHLDDLPTLIGRDERDPDAGGAGAAGATDAVNVGLRIVRRVEVDDMRDPGDVDPASRDIGRDQRVDLVVLELRERAFALALGLVAVHGHRGDALARELLDELVGAVLGAHEDQRQVALALQMLDERVSRESCVTSTKRWSTSTEARRSDEPCSWKIASFV